MANNTIKTALGTYVHCTMAPEVSTLLASPKKSKPRKPAAPRIKVGAKVLFCGIEATVIAKHSNKGWWTVEVNGKQTSGDRKLIKVI